MYCTRCGHKNSDDNNFCTKCGSPLKRKNNLPDPTSTPPSQVSETKTSESGLKGKQDEDISHETREIQTVNELQQQPSFQNKYDEHGNLILPVYEEEKKNYTGIIIGVIAVLLIIAGGWFFLFRNGIFSNQDQQVKEFAVKFGDFVNTNQKDSIQKYYPDFELTDSLARVPSGNITVTPQETEGVYLVEYSPESTMIVSVSQNGKIIVDKSKGILGFSNKMIEILEKEGVWKDNLSDMEISKLINNETEKRDEEIHKQMQAFTPSLFIKKGSYWEIRSNVPSSLKNIGFTLKDKKLVKELICYNCGSGDEEMEPGYKISYENPELGIVVSWTYEKGDKESQINEVNGIEIEIGNKEMNDLFLSNLKKNYNYRKEGDRYEAEDVISYELGVEYQGNGKYLICYIW